MQTLNVCFVGVGSIAKRHIRNLKTICAEREIDLSVDACRRSDMDEAQKRELGISNVYTKSEQVPDGYDAIFITNPTEMHLQTLLQFHKKGKHFFIEKPLVSQAQLDEAGKIATREDSIYYIACPLRYNAVIQYIKNNIDLSKVIAVRSISSSYLPDWRPGTDYRDTYSAHKDLGGGVSIDLIHEWDYLTHLFGFPGKVETIISRKSNLEIDSDDLAIYIAEYPDKTVELHLDYFGRQTIREIMLFTEDDTIVGDIARNKITFLRSGEVIDFKEERDDFQKRELAYFLDMMTGKSEKMNEIEHALSVLHITQGVLRNNG